MRILLYYQKGNVVIYQMYEIKSTFAFFIWHQPLYNYCPFQDLLPTWCLLCLLHSLHSLAFASSFHLHPILFTALFIQKIKYTVNQIGFLKKHNITKAVSFKWPVENKRATCRLALHFFWTLYVNEKLTV